MHSWRQNPVGKQSCTTLYETANWSRAWFLIWTPWILSFIRYQSLSRMARGGQWQTLEWLYSAALRPQWDQFPWGLDYSWELLINRLSVHGYKRPSPRSNKFSARAKPGDRGKPSELWLSSAINMALGHAIFRGWDLLAPASPSAFKAAPSHRDSCPLGELPHFLEQGCGRQTAAGTDTTNLWPGVSRQGRIVMAKCSQRKNSKSEFSIRAVKWCSEYPNPNQKNAGANSGSKSESKFTKPFCNSW